MIMAYCNVNQARVKKLILKYNISNIKIVHNIFKSSAYYAWNNLDLNRDCTILNAKRWPRRSRKNTHKRETDKPSDSSSIQSNHIHENMDIILVPANIDRKENASDVLGNKYGYRY